MGHFIQNQTYGTTFLALLILMKSDVKGAIQLVKIASFYLFRSFSCNGYFKSLLFCFEFFSLFSFLRMSFKVDFLMLYWFMRSDLGTFCFANLQTSSLSATVSKTRFLFPCFSIIKFNRNKCLFYSVHRNK